MTGEDIVQMIVVTTHNHVYIQHVTRREASDHMRSWYNARKVIGNGEGPEIDDKKSWLQWGTLSTKTASDDGSETFTHAVIGWNSIIGMYILEGSTSTDRLATAQEKIAKAISGELGRGEEWRGE